jgi:NAD-dependent deacetylase
MSVPANDYARAADAIRNGSDVIASTGAGISVESGIPDFRSADGLWNKYPPEEYATIEAFHANPAKVWSLWQSVHEQVAGCKPNPAHAALATLEEWGLLKAVITQNVDNLHQEAGSRRVIEYHGNARQVICLDCRHARPLRPELYARGVPTCVCGGLFKPDVVFFGEMIPMQAMLQSQALAQTADVVIIVGTSAQVFPAAELPYVAKENGAFIIECNVEPTDFTSTITDVFLEGRAGTTLPELARMLTQPESDLES